jgi:hypothetical protein
MKIYSQPEGGRGQYFLIPDAGEAFMELCAVSQKVEEKSKICIQYLRLGGGGVICSCTAFQKG